MSSQTHIPNLGERIRSARKRAGLSHDRLGAIVGTSRQHLIRIEKGVHAPRPDLLNRIAEATGTTLEDLSGSAEDDEESDVVASLLSRAILAAFDQRIAMALKSNAPAAPLARSTAGASTHGGYTHDRDPDA